jgi:hypothetical protein
LSVEPVTATATLREVVVDVRDHDRGSLTQLAVFGARSVGSKLIQLPAGTKRARRPAVVRSEAIAVLFAGSRDAEGAFAGHNGGDDYRIVPRPSHSAAG